jgi:Mg-chelatase subunit ChlD
VRFLNNRGGRKNFTYNGTKNELNANFAIKPDGSTPLKEALIEVRDAPDNQNKKLLIIIFTDGIPTESGIETSIANRNFRKELMKNEGTETYVSLVACTDEPGTIEYLNDCDTSMFNLDVNDD